MLRRHAAPLDSGTIVALLREERGHPASPEDSVSLYQAIDVMRILGWTEMAGGDTRVLTDLGREVLLTPALADEELLRSHPQLLQWAELEQLTEASRSTWATEENRILRLEIDSWRQFRHVEINFHPRLTVLTGANSAGKTTLLNVLAPHFRWQAQMLSSSARRGESLSPSQDAVGQLHYSNGVRTPIIQLPAQPGVQLSQLHLPSQQQVPGIFISSHRSISSFQAMSHLPAKFSTADVLLQQFYSEVQSRYHGQSSSSPPPLYRMKEALIAAAAHGYGNAAMKPNDEAREVWEGFQEVLVHFLPRSLQFRRLFVEDAAVFVQTASTSFPLEAVSGGVSAMLELAWQIFLRGRESASFTVCIDEPENHLHPELQRSIMPALLESFPRASFIVATHSPFVVTSTNDQRVYALASDDRHEVTSRQIEQLNTSGTADETLRMVLGLDTPLPLWVEQRLERALARVPARPSVHDLRTLREELLDAGLGDQFPAALDSLGDNGRD